MDDTKLDKTRAERINAVRRANKDFEFDKLSDYTKVYVDIAFIKDQDGKRYISPPKPPLNEQYDEVIYLHDFTDTVLRLSKDMVSKGMAGDRSSGIESDKIEVRKGPDSGMSINFYVEDRQIAEVCLSLDVDTRHFDCLFPNGDSVIKLQEVSSWAEIEQYENMAKEMPNFDPTVENVARALYGDSLKQPDIRKYEKMIRNIQDYEKRVDEFNAGIESISGNPQNNILE